MKIKCSYKFFAYKRANYKDKGASIRMRITLRGQQPVDIATGFVINVDEWDTTTQTARDTCINADEINRTVNTWKATLSEVLSRYELIEKRIPTRGELKELFNDLVGHATPVKSKLLDKENVDFFVCFDVFTKTVGRKNQWTASTFQKFRALKQHLRRFDALLSFQTLTETKLQQFVDYMLARDMRNTTIAKQLSFVRWFLRWAFFNEYYRGHLHETFKPKLKGITTDNEIIYLSSEELQQMMTHVFPRSQKALEQVRDVFLFCCFSGLRYSDVAKLRRSDIKNDHFLVVTKKTVDGLRIELNRHTRAILDKYKDEHFANDLALPVISNVKMNIHLKSLGKVCNIDEPTRIVYFQGNKRMEDVYPKWQLLTTHVARRTFVVTALQLGIPAEVIMRWTGHSRFEAMKPYIAIVDDLKRISMSKFDSI